MTTQGQMANAEYNDQRTAIDGHVIPPADRYQVVITVGNNESWRSEALMIKDASTRMAKLIKFQMSAMGYKQVPGATITTLKNGKIEMQYQIVKVVR